MAILLPAAPACNAGATSDVRPDPDPIPVVVPADEPDNEFFTGEYTDAKFKEFLDAIPGRRWEYEGDEPDEQAEERQQAARLFALRTSPMPADLLAAVMLADQLRATLEEIVNRYAPMEARRVLEAFGVSIPVEKDICRAWGGDSFVEPRRKCRRLVPHLKELREVVWDAIQFLIPPELRNAAEGGAK